MTSGGLGYGGCGKNCRVDPQKSVRYSPGVSLELVSFISGLPETKNPFFVQRKPFAKGVEIAPNLVALQIPSRIKAKCRLPTGKTSSFVNVRIRGFTDSRGRCPYAEAASRCITQLTQLGEGGGGGIPVEGG